MTLSLAVTYNWPLRQLDNLNAFLHGIPKEIVSTWLNHQDTLILSILFMFANSKSLFMDLNRLPKPGLIGSPANYWSLNSLLHKLILPFVIFKEGNFLVYLLANVDDIVLIGNNTSVLHSLIKKLSPPFEFKDVGDLNNFLGLQMDRTSQGLFLNQTKYATNKVCSLPGLPKHLVLPI